MTTQGVLEAVSGAIGEADNEIGGFILTRLTEAIAPTTALAAVFIWDGTTTVLTSDTSEVAIGDWIDLKSPGELALSATYTWNGTTTVACADTSEVEAGDWIRLGSDPIWYEIQSIIPNTSVTISNPGGFTIPTGATQSLKGSDVDISGQLFQIVNLTLNTSVEIDNPVGYDIPSGTYPSSKATRNLPVESVLDWDDEDGKVGLDGIVYYYASRTDTELQDVVHLRGGVLTVGVKKIHNVEAPVMDLNRSRTALDLLRRAMLVAYAEGDDLNAIGRNLGVERYPFLASDDVFREIVQAVAYNPKGTMFGLELALDALVGEGNYEIKEYLISDPCTVFIRLLGAASTDDISEGKAFLTGPEYQPPTSDTTVDINESVVTRGSVGGVRWKDENLLTDCRTAYPSAHLITEYPGDTPHQAWSLSGLGVIEGTHITLVGSGTEDGAMEFTLVPPFTSANYRRTLRLRPESYAWANMVVTIPVGSPSDLAIPTNMWFGDGERRVSIGVKAATASVFFVGFESGGAMITNAGSYQRGTFVEISLRKRGREPWELYGNGQFIASLPYASGVATGGGGFIGVGVFAAGATSNQMQVKQIGVWGTTFTDYWAARGTGSVGLGGNQERLDVGSAFFVSTDVGKLVQISGASNDRNHGQFEIASLVSSQAVDMQGPLNGGLEAQYNGNSTYVRVPDSGQQFQYPDDIGKEVLISGSVSGNDGPEIITDLLHPGTLLSLGLGATPIPEKTTVAVCSGATYVPETGLSWRLNPVFIPEGGIDWELSDAGSVSGTTITLRQALPLTSAECYRVLQVLYSNVLSAQVLLNSLVDNEVIQTFPDLLFAYYPFYLADPLGYVRSYLDTLTAAGVIPDFTVV